ncbi:unnamed protein product [Withania somnifera]
MDCEVSSLFYDEEYDVVYGFVEEDRRYRQNDQEKKSFYVEESLTCSPLILMQSEECLSLMIEKECEHMPAADYFQRLTNGDLDIGARDEILQWIVKVHSHFKFGPMCAYLCVNYLDRFLSVSNLPKDKVWMMQLLGVACFSLSVKMEETVPSCLDLQVAGDAKFVFEVTTIQRMERLVLSSLNWRMQAITPFSFMDYFLKKINGNQIVSINQSVQLILSTLRELHLLKFKPSEIAAAVAIIVATGVKTETGNSEKAIPALVQHVQEEKVMKCIELIRKSSVPQSSSDSLDATSLR